MLAKTMKKEFQFFHSLSDQEVSHFLNFCENSQVAADSTLWREGDDSNHAAFIISGRLGIKKRTEFDGKHVIVGTYGKGSVVGELCLLTDNARSVTAEVIESSDLVILTSENFERLITEHPLLGLKLLKHIFIMTSKRLNKTYDRIASIF